MPTSKELYTFRGQRSNEEVLLVTQQHVAVMMPVLFYWLFFIILLIILLKFVGASGYSSYVIFIGLGFGILYTIYRWYLWSNGVFIVTNERVIEIEQHSLFHREIGEAELEKIQEVTTDIKGFTKTFLGYGDVDIQTASAKNEMELRNIPSPYDVQQIIVTAQKKVAHTTPAITSDLKDDDV